VNQVYGRGVGAGIVCTHNFDRSAITGAIFFNDNDTIIRLLGGANARQTNHDHGDTFPFKLVEYSGETAVETSCSFFHAWIGISPTWPAISPTRISPMMCALGAQPGRGYAHKEHNN
jgi:hypothetical protein